MHPAIANSLHKARTRPGWWRFSDFYEEFVLKEDPNIRYLEAYLECEAADVPMDKSIGITYIKTGGE